MTATFPTTTFSATTIPMVALNTLNLFLLAWWSWRSYPLCTWLIPRTWRLPTGRLPVMFTVFPWPRTASWLYLRARKKDASALTADATPAPLGGGGEKRGGRAGCYKEKSSVTKGERSDPTRKRQRSQYLCGVQGRVSFPAKASSKSITSKDREFST